MFHGTPFEKHQTRQPAKSFLTLIALGSVNLGVRRAVKAREKQISNHRINVAFVIRCPQESSNALKELKVPSPGPKSTDPEELEL